MVSFCFSTNTSVFARRRAFDDRCCTAAMPTFGARFSTSCFCILLLLLLRSGTNGDIDIKNEEIAINEDFLKEISHHYCDRLTGTHVVLLAEKSAALFYQVLRRSFQSTFYIHGALAGNFSLGDYYVLYVEGERFFSEKSICDQRLWHTTKTYLIVSESKLTAQNVWPHIRCLWDKFKVFKISLLHSDDLRVLRVFDDGFRKHAGAGKPSYGIGDVKKYPLRAVVFPRIPSIMCNDGVYTGPDWNTLQMFAKRMNFTLILTVLSDQSGFGSLVNGTYTGVLAEVVYGWADVSFNSRFLNDPTTDKPYRYTNTYGLDYICFVVPSAGPLSTMQILWKTFTVEVWLCMAVTYALMTKSFQFFNKFNLLGDRKISDPSMTSLQVLQECNRETVCLQKASGYLNVLTTTTMKLTIASILRRCKVILGMGVYSLPKHVAGRLFLVSCSAACFVVVSLFQASMVTKLSVATVQNEIDTLEELDQSGMEIRTSLFSVRDSLAMYSYTKSLADKIDLEKDRRDYVSSKFVFMARIMNSNIAQYWNYIGHFSNDSVQLHVVRECPLKYYLSYAVALDFPFLDELNDLLTRLQEAGISDKWRVDIKKLQREYYKPVVANTSNSYSLNDLWFAFVFLFVGYIMSTIVLIFEFILKKVKN